MRSLGAVKDTDSFRICRPSYTSLTISYCLWIVPTAAFLEPHFLLQCDSGEISFCMETFFVDCSLQFTLFRVKSFEDRVH